VLDPVKQNISLRAPAKDLLEKSDIVVIRCYAASVPVPPDWDTYRKQLRNIMNGTDTTSIVLPTRPPYPENL